MFLKGKRKDDKGEGKIKVSGRSFYILLRHLDEQWEKTLKKYFRTCKVHQIF